MTVPANCPLIGRWRIVEADIWDRDFFDHGGSATITIGTGNHGEIAFGAMQAPLDVGYGQSMVFFTWIGFDEMDEVSGEGHAELLDEVSVEIAFAWHRATRQSSKQSVPLLQQPAKARSPISGNSVPK